MNVQDAKDLTITEGNVRTIHDSVGKQLWGKLNYTTTYNGDTTQQTYTGKNLWSFNTGTFTNNSGSSQTQTHTDTTLILTAAGTNGAQFITWITPELDSTKTYTISGKAKKIVKGTDGQPYIRVAYSYSDDGSTWASNSDAYNNTSVTQGEEYSFSYTLPSGHKYYRLRCYNNTYTPVTIGESTTYYDLQLEANTTATAFEPYVGGSASPSPSYPQSVNVVTGTQTITVTGGTVSNNFTLNLATLELCKIGTNQDYIYKSGDDWYIRKATDKVIFTGDISESWALSGQPANYLFNTPLSLSLTGASAPLVSNNFMWHNSASASQQNAMYVNSGGRIVFVNPISGGVTLASNLDEWRTWLSTHNTTVYYALATSTDTKITDTSLITQLEAIHEWMTRYGYTATVSGNIPIIINQTTLS